ncbi:MurR/RpiR family transcriptional regulator [Enterococcus ureasiticus]|uniref:RpiR family transcriptional regulator n=1 Tax=Enterococcus ureasiticus TaxID=903984 RepID=A0A1E5GA65_9ENTE|nr:MurR/RpiR family transcriptional regulator [Enterococcus ureasiticus]OEG09606.1 RpiR family transcriptional regulator [Enterococcus ureasiticus]
MLFLNETPSLNDTDTTIYKYIVSHLNDMNKMSIRELADNTHTSTASILRFCKKFKTSGYSEFKLRLQAYLSSLNKNDLQTNNTELDEELINFIVRSKDTFFKDKLEEAVELLLEKELVIFIGIGTSNITAEYGALFFSSLFNMAIRIEDPNNYPINYLSDTLAKKMCIVALSVSGETKEIITYLNHLNLSNSSIISVTNSSKSTIARLADISIPYYISMEKIDESNVTTQIPAIFIIEQLAREVRKRKLQLDEQKKES